MLSKWTSLSLQEFIRVLEDKSSSPIIDECVQRFQQILDRGNPAHSQKLECPVCEAPVIVHYDPDKDHDQTIENPFDIEEG